jgi:hypothetical protein
MSRRSFLKELGIGGSLGLLSPARTEEADEAALS